MSDRQFERTVHDWLEDGSDRTPPTAIDAVLFAIRSTPQERDLPIPRRFIQMPNYLRYAAAAIVLLVAVGGAISLGRPSVGPPAASPTLSATTPAPPATQLPASALVPFTSAQYGYTISLPKGWGAQAATRALHGTEPLFGNDPQVGTPAGDSIMGGLFGQDAAALGRLLIAGGAIPAGTTLESWTADTALVKCGAPTTHAAITIDGEAATLSTYASCAGLFMQWVTVLHGGWAWHIDWINNPGSEGTDVVVFKQLLATFRFAGSSATIPRGPLSGTYTTTTFTPAVTFTVGAGWSNKLELADEFRLWMGDGAHQLAVARVDGDPIRFARPNPDFTIGTPFATTVAGLPAQEVSLVLSPTAGNISGGFALGAFVVPGDRNALVVQHAGSTSRVIWLQVAGQEVAIVIERPTGDTTDFDQQVQAILASMSFN